MNVEQLRVGPVQTNCYIAYGDDKIGAVIDPGLMGDKINNILKEKGITLSHILLTHVHFDHIGGVKKLKELNPNAKVVIGEKDAPDLQTAHLSFRAAVKAYINEYTDIPCDETVIDGDIINCGELTFKVLETPGHTRGGVCYMCKDSIFTGDTLFREEVGRCDLDGGDYLTILRSVKRLAALPGDYAIYPGHEASSTLSHERIHNRYINSKEV